MRVFPAIYLVKRFVPSLTPASSADLHSAHSPTSADRHSAHGPASADRHSAHGPADHHDHQAVSLHVLREMVMVTSLRKYGTVWCHNLADCSRRLLYCLGVSAVDIICSVSSILLLLVMGRVSYTVGGATARPTLSFVPPTSPLSHQVYCFFRFVGLQLTISGDFHAKIGNANAL